MLEQRAAIHIANLSKRFEIYEAPRDRLKQFLLPSVQKLTGQPVTQHYREFWALQGVTFDVQKGETVGIIGRNGAGKSTLLQLICGTLSPTTGEVSVQGRVAALLELGSGFNSEFTGRENIRMNAGILGLTEAEIDARFEAIVAFADIGAFLDQPAKTYSSGMYVRLAFAVVVHVDADVLIVDEALSVGDMHFQAKCMVHMKKLMSQGVTVLFVSHDVGAVKALCSRAVYLEHGRIVASGPTDEVVEAYYGAGVRDASISQPMLHANADADAERGQVNVSLGLLQAPCDAATQAHFAKRAAFHRVQNGKARFLDVQLLDTQHRAAEVLEFGQTVVLRMVFKALDNLPSVGLAYHIRDRNGVDVIYSDTGIERCPITLVNAGEVVVIDWEFTAYLREGDYAIAAMLSIPHDLSIGDVDVCDFAPLAFNFQVIKGQSLPIYGAAYWANKVSLHRQPGGVAVKNALIL